MGEYSAGGGDLDVKKIYNLKSGQPDATLLEGAVKLFHKGISQLQKFIENDKDATLFKYIDEQGFRHALEELSKFLSKQFQMEIDPRNLFLSNGSSHGLSLLATLLQSRTDDTVFATDPTYMLALDYFTEDLQKSVIPVPIEEDGISVSKLRLALSEHAKPKPNDHSSSPESLLYIIPNFDNPTGICISTEKAKELIDIAHAFNVYVICDDVYDLLYFDNSKPPQRLIDLERNMITFQDQEKPGKYDKRGKIISIGTFSKLFAPGIKAGWIQAPKYVIDKLVSSGTVRSGGGYNGVNHYSISTFINTPEYQQYLQHLRTELKHRRDCVVEILQENKDLQIRYIKPEGGYFIWIQLPVLKSSEFVRWLEVNYQTAVHSGEAFSVCNTGQNFVRICFAFTVQSDIKEGTRRFCQGLRRYLDDTGATVGRSLEFADEQEKPTKFN